MESTAYLLLFATVAVLVAGAAIYFLGRSKEKQSQQAEMAHKSWEEAEYDKHLDAITPSTNSDIYERLRRNTKG